MRCDRHDEARAAKRTPLVTESELPPAGHATESELPPTGHARLGAAEHLVEAHSELPHECNEYRRLVAELATCDRMPKQSVDALQQGLHALDQAWAKFGALPVEAREAIADGCRQGVDALRQAASAMCGRQ